MPAPQKNQSNPSLGGSAVGHHIDENIESVVALRRKEWESVSGSQRRLEHVSRLIARPLYLYGLIGVIAAWVAVNSAARILGFRSWDTPPFEWLDGIMTFTSLVTTTVVLIAQNRQSKLEQQHTHLALQVNLVTEQKVSKLIHLIEELRRDLPMVKDRQDPQAEALQERTDMAQMISAIEEVGLTDPNAQHAIPVQSVSMPSEDRPPGE